MIRSPLARPQRVSSFSNNNSNNHRIDSLLQVPHPAGNSGSSNYQVDNQLEQQLQGQQPQEQSRQFREDNGLCLSCGQQLYKIRPGKKSSVIGARALLLKKRLSLRKLHCGIKSQHSPTGEEQESAPISNTNAIKKKPLTISGQVERGQCLNCNASPVPETSDESSMSFHELELSESSSPKPQNKLEELQQHAIYKGSFNVYGERDGKGTMTWENGDAYTGDFFNGNRHGHGTLQFADGSEYVGGWECNQQHGVGTRRWNNGDCYTGQYSRGQRTGEGRFYFANGDLYVGGWQRNVLHGFGRYYYSNGQRFEGDFVAGQRQGKGKLQRRDGSLDVGVYSNDKRCGVGVRWSADRTQAWRMLDGKLQKRITVAEAVALDYEMEAHAERVMRTLSPSGDDTVPGVV